MLSEQTYILKLEDRSEGKSPERSTEKQRWGGKQPTKYET